MKVEDYHALLQPRLPERNPIVLSAGPLIGLGDQAVLTTLPERFSKLGYDVYLDADTDTSNPEIGELLWERNPFIKGPSNLKPNAGYVNQGLIYKLANILPGNRGIEAVERAHGLPPPYSMAPKVYYEPKPTTLNVAETVLMDYSAVSSTIARDRADESVQMMAQRFAGRKFLQLIHPPWVVFNQEQYIESAYMVTSIFEYVDLLSACYAWVGSEAGGQALASAVRGERDVYDLEARPEIVVTATRQTYNSGLYRFRNVDYHVTANDGKEDWWHVLELKTYEYEIACKARGVETRGRLAKHG